jgi:hypothetical protein
VDDSRLLKTGCSGEYPDLRGSTRKKEKIHNKEFPNLGSLPKIKINKLRGVRCMRYVSLMGEMRNGMQNFRWKTQA